MTPILSIQELIFRDLKLNVTCNIYTIEATIALEKSNYNAVCAELLQLGAGLPVRVEFPMNAVLSIQSGKNVP